MVQSADADEEFAEAFNALAARIEENAGVIERFSSNLTPDGAESTEDGIIGTGELDGRREVPMWRFERRGVDGTRGASCR